MVRLDLLALLIYLSVSSSLGAPVPASAAQVVAQDYCAVSRPPRYCVMLYDQLNPNVRSEAQLFPVVVAGVPTNLFAFSDLSSRLQALTGPVGRIAIHRRRISAPYNDYVSWCTGTVITGNYVITAAHCIPGSADDEYVVKATLVLGYRRAGDDRETQSYAVVGDPDGCEPSLPQPAVCPERGNWAYDNTVDFAVVRLAPNANGSASDAFGVANLAPTQLERRASVFVPQHPMARQLFGNYAPVGDDVNAGQRTHFVTTFQMSSGSPVFSVDEGTLVGVHIGEGDLCSDARVFCTNRFVTIEAIATRSPIVASLRELDTATPDIDRVVTVESSEYQSLTRFEEVLASANAGDARSNWILGVKYEYASDPIERRLLGVPDYENEPGLITDESRAVAYYRVAADAGFVPAIVDLASFYYEGEVVVENRELAIQMLERAAEQGDARAQEWLSRLHEQEGSGVVRDFAIAAQYLRKAADGGAPRSQYDLAFQILTSSGARQDEWGEAISLLERSAQAGYPNASYLLGEQYRDGIKVPLDLVRSRQLYRQAADDGLVEAQIRLEQLGWSE